MRTGNPRTSMRTRKIFQRKKGETALFDETGAMTIRDIPGDIPG